MNVPDEHMDELIAIFTAVENGAVEAGAISFADAVEGALPAVLDRHEQMVLERKATEIETYLTGNNREWDRAIEQVARDLRAGAPPEIVRAES